MEKKLLMEWDELARKELAQLPAEDELLESIQNVYIEASELALALGEIVFGEIYPGRHFHCGPGSWKFSRQVDEVILKEEDSPFWLQIVLPGGEFSSQDKAQLLLLQDDALYTELYKVLKVEAILRPAFSASALSAQPSFVSDLNQQVSRWRRSIRSRLEQDLQQAQIFAQGEPVKKRGRTGAQVVEEALLGQLRQLYPRFHYVQDHIRSEAQLQSFIKKRNVQFSLLLMEPENQRALDEMENFISSQTQAGRTVYLIDLYHLFTRSPYGWLKLDVESLLIQLLKDQRVQLYWQEQLISIDHPDLAGLLKEKTAPEIQISLVQESQVLDSAQVQTLLKLVFEEEEIPLHEPGRRLALVENLENRLQQVNQQIQAHLADPLADCRCLKDYRHILNTILMQKGSTDGMLAQLAQVQEDFKQQSAGFEQLKTFLLRDGTLYSTIWQWRSSLEEDESCLKQDETMARLLDQMDQIFRDPLQYLRFDELLGLYNQASARTQKQSLARQLKLTALLDEWIARFEEFEKEIGSFSAKPAQTLEFLRAKKEHAAKTWKLAALDQDLKQMDLYCQNTLPILERILKNKNRKQSSTSQTACRAIPQIKAQVLFAPARLENEAQVKAYLEKAEARLMAAIQADGAVEIK